MLTVKDLSASYGPISALNEVSLEVEQGEIVAIVGANGVGKTTLLKTIAGLIQPTGGNLLFKGTDITRLASHRRIKDGVVLVPEGRRLFADLSVHENLRLGAFPWRRGARGAEIDAEIDSVFELFPILRERRAQLAGTLSGGQQQMVAIGRGLVSRPSLLLLDEPSLGLAPLIIRQIFATLADLAHVRGLSIVLVEQDAQAAFRIASRGYVMQRGRILLTGAAKDLLQDPRTKEIYFGKNAI
jgi:branched-chain amino acid transport system ATP-binding protein